MLVGQESSLRRIHKYIQPKMADTLHISGTIGKHSDLTASKANLADALSLSLAVDEELGIYYFILVFDSCACGASVLLWTESLCSPSPYVNAPTPSATWGLQRE